MSTKYKFHSSVRDYHSLSCLIAIVLIEPWWCEWQSSLPVSGATRSPTLWSARILAPEGDFYFYYIKVL